MKFLKPFASHILQHIVLKFLRLMCICCKNKQINKHTNKQKEQKKEEKHKTKKECRENWDYLLN